MVHSTAGMVADLKNMAIENRLTQMLEIEHPILLAPMDIVSGGRLAAAVSHAGGPGLLGGGYGDSDWIDHEWDRAAMPASAAVSSPGVWLIDLTSSSAPLHADLLPLCFRSVIPVPSP